jgi:hypothetical protein
MLITSTMRVAATVMGWCVNTSVSARSGPGRVVGWSRSGGNTLHRVEVDKAPVGWFPLVTSSRGHRVRVHAHPSHHGSTKGCNARYDTWQPWVAFVTSRDLGDADGQVVVPAEVELDHAPSVATLAGGAAP